MDEMVTQYLTQAYAFVYVIDTSNSGGVNKNRVGIEMKLRFLKILFFNDFHCNLPATIFFTSKTQELPANRYKLE